MGDHRHRQQVFEKSEFANLARQKLVLRTCQGEGFYNTQGSQLKTLKVRGKQEVYLNCEDKISEVM